MVLYGNLLRGEDKMVLGELESTMGDDGCTMLPVYDTLLYWQENCKKPSAIITNRQVS